jgi:hypothetical protein
MEGHGLHTVPGPGGGERYVGGFRNSIRNGTGGVCWWGNRFVLYCIYMIRNISIVVEMQLESHVVAASLR